jgi:hypothetical protein
MHGQMRNIITHGSYIKQAGHYAGVELKVIVHDVDTSELAIREATQEALERALIEWRKNHNV